MITQQNYYCGNSKKVNYNLSLLHNQCNRNIYIADKCLKIKENSTAYNNYIILKKIFHQ